MSEPFVVRAEVPEDDPVIRDLHARAFGPGAYVRAAFRVREEAPHDPRLSLVGLVDGRLASSVRLTHVTVGARGGLLLGPLVVTPDLKNRGFGKALLRAAVERAAADGIPFVVLVGDLPYYGPFGFRRLPSDPVRMPAPADPARILVAETSAGGADGLAGVVRGREPPSGQLQPSHLPCLESEGIRQAV